MCARKKGALAHLGVKSGKYNGTPKKRGAKSGHFLATFTMLLIITPKSSVKKTKDLQFPVVEQMRRGVQCNCYTRLITLPSHIRLRGC